MVFCTVRIASNDCKNILEALRYIFLTSPLNHLKLKKYRAYSFLCTQSRVQIEI